MKTMKLMLSVAILSFTTLVQADYLYWMVDSVEDQEVALTDYAMLYANQSAVGTSTSNRYFYDPGLKGIYGITDVSGFSDEDLFSVGVYRFADVSEFSSIDDYYMNDGITLDPNSTLAKSAMTLSQLRESGFVRSAADLGSKASDFWNATSVPEPTGGVLLLLGLSALALRRKESV